MPGTLLLMVPFVLLEYCYSFNGGGVVFDAAETALREGVCKQAKAVSGCRPSWEGWG